MHQAADGVVTYGRITAACIGISMVSANGGLITIARIERRMPEKCGRSGRADWLGITKNSIQCICKADEFTIKAHNFHHAFGALNQNLRGLQIVLAGHPGARTHDIPVLGIAPGPGQCRAGLRRGRSSQNNQYQKQIIIPHNIPLPPRAPAGLKAPFYHRNKSKGHFDLAFPIKYLTGIRASPDGGGG